MTTDGKEEFVAATAFIIGDFFGCTALHVMDDLVNRYGSHQDENEALPFVLHLLLIHPKFTGPLKVSEFYFRRPLDIAILRLEIPSHLQWPQLPLISLAPPQVGEKVTAFGFPDSITVGSNVKNSANAHLFFRSSSGLVEELHHERRDSSGLNFPCFRFDARIDGGMSGGPILNSAGHICGVICSSLPATSPDDSHSSYGVPIWPASVIPFAKSNRPERIYRIFDLFSSGIIKTSDAFSCVSMVRKRYFKAEIRYLGSTYSWSTNTDFD